MRRALQGFRVVPALAALLVASGLLACSPMTRYKVLNFFFDGVPPPPGMVVDTLDQDRQRERSVSTFSRGIAAIREAAPRPAAVPGIQSTHPPYRDRDCQKCHDMTLGGMQDTARDASLCDRCHYDQRKEEGWDHGPINLGSCIPCHVPHASVHKSLLSDPIPKLCLDCHMEVSPDFHEHHDVHNFLNCVECHDPHRMY